MEVCSYSFLSMSRLRPKFAVKVCSQSQQLKMFCVKKSTKIKFLCVKKSTKIKFLRVKKSTKIKFLWVEKVCNLQMCHPKVPRPLRKIPKAQGWPIYRSKDAAALIDRRHPVTRQLSVALLLDPPGASNTTER